MTQPKSSPYRNPDEAHTALSALAAQLANRSGNARPMRSSMERAYRTVIDRERARLALLGGRTNES